MEGLLHRLDLLGRVGEAGERGLHVVELGEHGLELRSLRLELAVDGGELVARRRERVDEVAHELQLLAGHDPSELVLQRGELVAREAEAAEDAAERIGRRHGPTVPWHAAPMRVVGLDHIVLNVADVRRSLAFYVDTLGLAPERVEEWEREEVFFPSVRIDATTIIDLIATEPTGENLNHLCLVVDDDVDELAASGALEVVDGPGERWGAQGIARSLYVRDPDGNVVELRKY